MTKSIEASERYLEKTVRTDISRSKKTSGRIGIQNRANMKSPPVRTT